MTLQKTLICTLLAFALSACGGLMGGGEKKSNDSGVAAGAAAKPSASDYKPPKSEVAVDSVFEDQLGLFPTILVPTAYVMMPVSGKVSVTEQGSALAEMRTGGNANTVKASAKFAVKGLDKALAQKIAAAACDDLVKQLRAAGFTVLTYADVKDRPVFKEADREKPDAPWGVPTDDTRDGGMTMLWAAPSDEQVFEKGMVGGIWNQFISLGKTKVPDVVMIIPEYTITAPQMWGNKSESYSSISASIGGAPAMVLTRADAFWFVHDTRVRMMKGIPGIHLKGQTSLSLKVGELVKVEDTTSGAANTFAKTLGFLTGTGSVTSESANFDMTIDRDAYMAAVVEGAKKFNAEVTKIAKANKK